MISYDDISQQVRGGHLDEDIVHPLPRLPGLLPVLLPALVTGGLDDLVVAVPQLSHVTALSLQGEGRHGQPQAHVVHRSSLFINRYLGRDGSKIIFNR